ncbi:hypothetical protein CCR80_08700 [Rhodothalassium salexigens]|uniref:pyridoxal phosphate-dependent decarboxylase family protein n=1 Tax=Rhodothalassium salexigens TaxID=1086 RepID=UPI0019115159|nr:pyridoxal-dependent decarboxylase [Rhodothalassium salexigens]MBK5921108.1 hypothetical protein [Rhodothalassium salexigens]
MTTDTALFPDIDRMAAVEDLVTARLAEARSAYRQRPALPEAPTQGWFDELADFTFEQPQDLQPLLDWSIDALETGMVHTTHPHHIGLFNPAPTFPAECAERLVNAYNPQVCFWSAAPKLVAIEEHVLRQVAQRAGLPRQTAGHFTSGGSEANATALWCSLTAAEPRFGQDGVAAFAGPPVIYTSCESHLAWVKLAHTTGLGRNAVRLVATDGHGRMDALALEREIQTDLSLGHVPVLIAATAGTTNAGMIDPLPACADLAEAYGMWCHVDAAWAGALIASPTRREALAGMERAHSVTIDGHKWFAMTMGAGMILVTRPEILEQTFDIDTMYMPDDEGSTNYYRTSTQWSRRFVGLRMFLSLANAGWSGYAAHVDHAIALIDRLVDTLTDAGWHLANESPAAVACLVPPEGPESVDRYLTAALEQGGFWISKAKLDGVPMLRFCVTNGRTQAADIDALAQFLKSQMYEAA